MKRRELLSLIGAGALAAEATLVGRWRSVDTTRGGIGGVIEIADSGTVKYTTAALVDAAYQLEGNVLTWSGKPFGFGWHPDGRFQLNFGKGVLEDYSRVGPKAEGIVGEWRSIRRMGEQAVPVTFLLRENGNSLLVVWIRTEVGKLVGDGVALLKAKRYRMKRDGEGLLVWSGTVEPHRYVRF